MGIETDFKGENNLYTKHTIHSCHMSQYPINRNTVTTHVERTPSASISIIVDHRRTPGNKTRPL